MVKPFVLTSLLGYFDARVVIFVHINGRQPDDDLRHAVKFARERDPFVRFLS